VSDLGRLAVLISFLCAVYATGALAWGLRTGRSGFLRSGRNALWVVCATTVLAAIILSRALVARDFNYRYVAEHTSLDLPGGYAFASLWAGQEGSLLLWLLILCAYAAAFLWLYRRRLDPFYDAVAMVVSSVAVFFTFLLTFVCSPFRMLANPPADGMGLNPLLQDPGMMIHPPILYTGRMASRSSLRRLSGDFATWDSLCWPQQLPTGREGSIRPREGADLLRPGVRCFRG
jgi:cytochrome c-type biogenesis protein CcmF